MMPQKTKNTPMMEQYFAIKDQYPDCLLFYRLGDFYELFYEDAIEAARLLELTLTSRNKNAEDPIPMCGVPHHSAAERIKTLIENGKKVAICEQLEDPKLAKGMVKRGVIQVITPGTFTEYANQGANNYLVALIQTKKGYALTYVDVATGELKGTLLRSMEEVQNECSSLQTKELVVLETDITTELQEMCDVFGILISPVTPESVVHGEWQSLLEQIEDDALRSAFECLLSYVERTQLRSLDHLQVAEQYQSDFYLAMTYETRRNLELTSTIRMQQKHGSLLWFLDETQTAMGGRLLKQWVEKPLVVSQAIEERHQLVESLNQHYFERSDFIDALKRVYDLERIVGKVSFGSANARDLLQLKATLAQVPTFHAICESMDSSVWQSLREQLPLIPELYEVLDQAIDEDAPVSVTEGGVIRSGYDATLDTYRETKKNAMSWIIALEEQERELTGIKTLKVGNNNVFGYYIEVTKANLPQLHDDRYTRKQTLSNAERFVTPELQEKGDLIKEANERSSQLEYELFVAVREQVKTYTHLLQTLAKTVATIDVLQAFSIVSEHYQLVRPTMSVKDRELAIVDGRHPVVEKVMGKATYVPNSIEMAPDNHIILITGPNMSGKSTYMRQLALCVVMAQIGCFVPATRAKMPIFTKIFTRIGAADDLISGQSTFMVEMMETNTALRQADATSLLLFDEIGRGTATYDGMALAEAIIGYIHDHLHAKVLFSTHYHELTELSNRYADLKNVHVGALEQDGEVVFLHKIMEGPADKSYGIHVAKLAGLPEELLQHAQERLDALEGQPHASMPLPPTPHVHPKQAAVQQLSLFQEEMDPDTQAVIEDIQQTNLMNLTPLQAMQLIDQWQTTLKG